MTRSEILDVVETDDGLYLLFIDVEDDDGASAIGHVYRTSGNRDDTSAPVPVLATGDTLRVLWASPQGSLWVASADGNVATTASVGWSVPAAGAEYKTLQGPAWQATALPKRPDGLPPNIEVLWGTSDADVYAGTYGGHIYHWDGRRWTLAVHGPAQGYAAIRAFGGSGPDDVFAVGPKRLIMHFDGRQWRALPPPDPFVKYEVFTGVHCRAKDDVLISASVSGEEGRLLQGSAAGFTECIRDAPPLVDMAPLGPRLLFATSAGVAELRGNRIVTIKDNFQAAALSAGKERVFFIEPAQQDPCYIEHDPRRSDAPWWRMSY